MPPPGSAALVFFSPHNTIRLARIRRGCRTSNSLGFGGTTNSKLLVTSDKLRPWKFLSLDQCRLLRGDQQLLSDIGPLFLGIDIPLLYPMGPNTPNFHFPTIFWMAKTGTKKIKNGKWRLASTSQGRERRPFWGQRGEMQVTWKRMQVDWSRLELSGQWNIHFHTEVVRCCSRRWEALLPSLSTGSHMDRLEPSGYLYHLLL
jgi:hypothetical protein